MIDGKYLDMPTTELAGGSRFLYIFQSIFVKHLEVNPVVRFLTDTVLFLIFLVIQLDYVGPAIFQEIDPCEDLTDDEIRMAIQNATGTKTALFVPEV